MPTHHLTAQEVRPAVDFLLALRPKHPEQAYQTITELIGTKIGLKPASFHSFQGDETALPTFTHLLAALQLQSLVIRPSNDYALVFYSPQLETAKTLYEAWQASMDRDWQPNDPEDQRLTYQIGQLLGYPETAVQYFAYGPHDERGIVKHRPDADHDRYYIHSPKHFRTEYAQFEDILHPELAKLCSDLANLMRANSTKYWTSAAFASESPA